MKSVCLLAFFSALLSAFPLYAADENPASRPDIVLIMADDMGFSDIGCYGGEIDTPNLDKLAAEGLRFTQFYNTGRCCPTRASLMTGLYPHQAGVGHMMGDRGVPGYRGDLNRQCVTIAEVLGGAGYACYMSGKWHVTRQTGHWTGDKNLTSKHNWPRQRGFDRFYGTIHGAGSFFNPNTLTRDNEPIEPDGEVFYYTDAISDNAAKFITEHHAKKPAQPFFCYVPYTAPHWPLHALPQDIAKYKGRFAAGWDQLRRERLGRMVKMGLVEAKWKLSPRDRRAKEWENAKDKQWQQRRMEVYAAQIDRMDQGIGRIVEAIRKTGRLDNTLVMFLADNGGCAERLGKSKGGLSVRGKTRDGREVRKGNTPSIMPGPDDTYQSYGVPWANLSNTPFRLYKHYVHEGGIATPLVVHWPAGVTARGELRHQPGHLIDIMATCVDVSGAKYPKEFRGEKIKPAEGTSLRPAFANKPIEREAIYFEHEGNRAVRRGKWKLVARRRRNPWELYDIQADRTELDNLAEKHPEKTKELAEMWQKWAQRCDVLVRKPKKKRRPKSE